MHCEDCETVWYSRVAPLVTRNNDFARCVFCRGRLRLGESPAPAGEEATPALDGLRRAGETWRFARGELSALPVPALKALAAREHLPTTAHLVERLADEVADSRSRRDQGR